MCYDPVLPYDTFNQHGHVQSSPEPDNSHPLRKQGTKECHNKEMQSNTFIQVLKQGTFVTNNIPLRKYHQTY